MSWILLYVSGVDYICHLMITIHISLKAIFAVKLVIGCKMSGHLCLYVAPLDK